MNIDEYRNQLNEIDDKILELFIERMGVIKNIAVYKKENDITIENSSRENEIISNLLEKTDLYHDYIKILYSNIFEISKSYQQKIINGD